MPVKVGLRFIEKWKTDLEKKVRQYEQEPLEKGQIVFYGSSTFTRWDPSYGNVPLREVLLGKSGKPCCVNRGFGSSCAEHQLYYYDRMIRPLEPKVLVYLGSGNYNSFGYTTEEAWELAQRVIMYALTDFPDIHVYIHGTKPVKNMSEDYIERARKYDAMAKEFAENTPGCYFINCMDYEPMLRDDIYIADGVHNTPEGYELYADFFREKLKEEFDRF